MQPLIYRAAWCRVAGIGALAAVSLAFQTGGGLDDPVPAVGDPGGPSRALSTAELERWKRGRFRFDEPFSLADGLGTPEINADSCRACHQDPAIGGAGGLDLNVTRFGFDNGGLGPFQNLTGGQGLSKLRPPLVPGREEHEPQADVFEQRQTPTIFGGGLLDSVLEAAILANEDPSDLNGDGIRGRARVIDVGGGNTELGRFGWKGQVPRLADFVRDAMGGECGISTPADGRGFAMVSDLDAVPDPELSQAELDDVVFFLSNLAPHQRVGSTAQEVLDGELLFDTVGCASCHVPSLMGTNGPVPLYSDLLLHDVMPDTYRGMVEPDAEAGVFQTPPLWGLRDTAPYLHDGRAETIRDAIAAHEGEALGVRMDFDALAPGDQDALLAFLMDL